MSKAQLLLIAAGIALVGFLYFAGGRIPPPKEKAPTAARDANAEQGMQQTEVPQERWDVIQAKAIAQLNTNDKAEVESLMKLEDSAKYSKVAGWWKAKNQPYMTIKYQAEASKLVNSEKSLTFAAQSFIDLLNLEPEPAMRGWIAKEATDILDTVVARNPNNTNAKIMMASCLVEASNNPMQGVQMLLGIVRADSTNVAAQMSLGKFAIKSAQWPKAIARFETILRLQADNVEALYHLAECYKNSGNVTKAKELFTKWKQVIKNPQASKEMDEYLKTF
jgi:tetratricopeptide (TPR) repeat protein